MSARYIVMIVFFSALLLSCSSDKKDPAIVQPSITDKSNTPEITEPNVRYEIFKQDSGWGYDIYMDDKLYIHQPHIPAISGVQVFSSEADAQSIAGLVVKKINLHVMPPTVTTEELQALGIEMH